MLTFFIRRPRFAMVIALLLTFVGAVSLKLIPVEQYPAITPPVVNVSASWPGASASDVAEAIAAPLETQLNGVDHMLYMESTSSASSYRALLARISSDRPPVSSGNSASSRSLTGPVARVWVTASTPSISSW